jgi:hypothetical protein
MLRRGVFTMDTPKRKPTACSGSKYWLDGFPELLREWDYERNGDVRPTELTAGSGRRVWWTCPGGPDHRWRAHPNNRTYGTGCPFCANRRPSITNTLAALFAEIASEWHSQLNGALTPSDVVATSTRIAWWRCKRDKGHVWRACIRDRTRDLLGCPFCANARACVSNSLHVTHPSVSAEWHPGRNAALEPTRITSGSSKRVWWLCGRCGHEWRARVANRVSRSSGCPACSGRSAPILAPYIQETSEVQ